MNCRCRVRAEVAEFFCVSRKRAEFSAVSRKRQTSANHPEEPTLFRKFIHFPDEPAA